MCTALFSLLLALSCFIAPSRSHATVRNVPADFPSIQPALDASSFGDEVLVAPGSYAGALNLEGRHDGVRLASVGGPAVTTIDGGHTGTTISGNAAALGSGGGIYCDHGTGAIIRGNVIVDNSCAAFGGGVTIWESSTPALSLNTIVGNRAAMGGGGLYIVRYGHATVTSTIIAFNMDDGVVAGDAVSGCVFACSDVLGNTPGNFVAIADPTGSSGNQSADPLFCGLIARDLHLSDASPCASTRSPASCGREGALDPQCSVTPATRSTWGKLKANYR